MRENSQNRPIQSCINYCSAGQPQETMPVENEDLFAAAQQGDLEAFQEAAAAIDGDVREVKDANGANCLHIASHAGKTELCRHLLDHLNSDVNAADGSGSTPLVLAVAGKHYATAELLLAHSADANRAGSGEGAVPPLHLAVADGEVDLAGKLLAAGADVNAQSGSGSPLMLAAARANSAMIKLLLQSGASPNEAARQGLSPIFLAVAVGGSAECVQVLVEAGADVNARALGAFTPLHVAAEGGKADIAEVLLKAGADPEAKDEHGHTPARVAAMHGHRSLVEALLRRVGGSGGSSSSSGGGKEGSGGESNAASGGDGGAGAGPSSNIDAFMRSSKTELKDREAKASAAAASTPSSGASIVRIPEPEVADEALADTFKRKGNEFFVKGDYEGAAQLYGLALSHWTKSATVWSNRSACFLRLERYEQALQDAQIARTLDPAYVKAWYREGRAAEGLKRWEDAATSFYQAAQLQPDNEEFIRLTKEAIVEGRKEHQAQQEAQQAQQQAEPPAEAEKK